MKQLIIDKTTKLSKITNKEIYNVKELTIKRCIDGYNVYNETHINELSLPIEKINNNMKLFESFEINIKENIKEIYIEEKSGKFEIEDFFNNYKIEQIEEYFY